VRAGLDNLCNRINDWDVTWLGMRALRPAHNQDMTRSVVLQLCLFYGTFAALLGFAITFFMIRLAAAPVPAFWPWALAAAAGIGLCLMQIRLARAWNRRAARLRQSNLLQPPGK
jgi:hypothetical protein